MTQANSSSFFGWGNIPPESNTTEALVDQLTAQVAQVTSANSQAQAASTSAQAAANNALISETNVANLAQQATTTLNQANTAVATANAAVTSATASANTATTQANNATSQASAASTSATNAANSATAAASSASAASASQTAAASSASAASTSQTAAASSASAASASQSAAATSATNAATSATNASNSASSASTSASTATTQASNASSSASAALASQNAAATSATNASTSATNAANSATAAANSAASIALPLAITSGGTGQTTAVAGRTALGAAASGANSDITGLSGLTTALSVSQGGTGATTIATAVAALGLAGLMGRNKIINGNFDYWKRGTSYAANTTVGQYLADRWMVDCVGSSKAVSQQAFTLGQGVVPFEPVFFHRTVVTSVAGAANFVSQQQRIESVRTLAGQTGTLTFWAKADTNRSIAVEFAQVFGTGGSPSATVTGIGVTKLALTASWSKFTVTANIPSISGKTLGTNGDHLLDVTFWFDAGSNFNARTGTLGQQSGTFDIAQVQFEAGASATPFDIRLSSVETAMCQRYYYRIESSNAADVGVGLINSGTSLLVDITFPVTMRAIPTLTSLNLYGTSATQLVAGSSSSLTNASTQAVRLNLGCSGATWTAGQAGICIAGNGSGGWIAFESEL